MLRLLTCQLRKDFLRRLPLVARGLRISRNRPVHYRFFCSLPLSSARMYPPFALCLRVQAAPECTETAGLSVESVRPSCHSACPNPASTQPSAMAGGWVTGWRDPLEGITRCEKGDSLFLTRIEPPSRRQIGDNQGRKNISGVPIRWGKDRGVGEGLDWRRITEEAIAVASPWAIPQKKGQVITRPFFHG